MTEFYSQEALSQSARTLAAIGLDDGPTQPVRRGANGQIDYDFYLARGRRERSKAAYSIFRGIGRALKRVFTIRGKVEPSHLRHV